MQLKLKARLIRETAGAVLYGELDQNGHVINDLKLGNIGNIYIRKTTFERETIKAPMELSITVEC